MQSAIPYAVVASKLGSTPGCGVSARPLPEWALDETTGTPAGSGDARYRVRHRRIGSPVTVRASVRRLQFTTTSERPVISPYSPILCERAPRSGSWNRTACSSRAARHGRTCGLRLCRGGRSSTGSRKLPERPRWPRPRPITKDANPVPLLSGRPARHSSTIRPTPVDFAGSTPAVGPQEWLAVTRRSVTPRAA